MGSGKALGGQPPPAVINGGGKHDICTILSILTGQEFCH